MAFLRSLVHALALACLNLGGIWLGFLAHALGPGHGQLVVQVPVAFLFSLAAFSLWMWITQSRGPALLRLRRPREALHVYALAPVCAALVFVPLHHLTQPYLTSMSNLLALWGFQAATNAFAVGLGTAWFVRPGGAAGARSAGAA